MSTRAKKLAALARDKGATEAERQRAQEALDRLRASGASVEDSTPDYSWRSPTPLHGSAEWFAAQRDHQAIIAQCISRLGDSSLSPAEVLTVRNWARYIGFPWGMGAEELRRIHAKLMAGAVQGPEPIALAYDPMGT